MADFKQALTATLKHEGGYANIPGDNGLETYCGISRANWSSWRGWVIIDNAKPVKHNAKIKDERLNGLIEVFYYEHFWKPLQGDKIKDQKVAGLLFDFYVNSGYHAIQTIQKIAGVKTDGKIGPVTLAAINAMEPDLLFATLKAHRLQFYKNIVSHNPSQQKFMAGWQARLNSFV